MDLDIVEVPIRYRSRSVREGKKIGLRDAWEAVGTLWRWRRWKVALRGVDFATPAQRRMSATAGTRAVCSPPASVDVAKPL